MINKVSKLGAALLTVATAQDARPDVLTPQEVFDHYISPEVAGKGTDWGLGIFGFFLGAGIEAGANLGAIQPCVGQVADVMEALYFTYFYIRLFVNERGVEFISYLSVYIARGIESTTNGPCWSFNKDDIVPRPSE